MMHFKLPSSPQEIYENAEAIVEKALLDEALPFPEGRRPNRISREWIRIDYVMASELLTNLGLVVKNDLTGKQYVFGVNRHTHTAQLVGKH